MRSSSGLWALISILRVTKRAPFLSLNGRDGDRGNGRGALRSRRYGRPGEDIVPRSAGKPGNPSWGVPAARRNETDRNRRDAVRRDPRGPAGGARRPSRRAVRGRHGAPVRHPLLPRPRLLAVGREGRLLPLPRGRGRLALLLLRLPRPRRLGGRARRLERQPQP